MTNVPFIEIKHIRDKRAKQQAMLKIVSHCYSRKLASGNLIIFIDFCAIKIVVKWLRYGPNFQNANSTSTVHTFLKNYFYKNHKAQI